jgi:L-glyceraldehyde 3-phosphate reductase
MFNRWVEGDLLRLLEEEGVGCIAFSPLAQGLLTDRYLKGIPEDSRVRSGQYFSEELVNEQNLRRVRALAEIAQRRGQTLAQMALAWVLRDSRVTSALVGVSSVNQLESNLAALDRLDFDPAELSEIDDSAQESHVNIWKTSSNA